MQDWGILSPRADALDPGVESGSTFLWGNVGRIPAFAGEEVRDQNFVGCEGGEVVGAAEDVGVETADVFDWVLSVEMVMGWGLAYRIYM